MFLFKVLAVLMLVCAGFAVAFFLIYLGVLIYEWGDK